MSSFGILTQEQIEADPEFQDHPVEFLEELEAVYGVEVADELWDHALHHDS